MKRVVWTLGALVILVALDLVLPKALNPYFFQVMMLCGINVMLAVSLNLINGFTGQFSIGHAGFMAIGAYGSAMLPLPHGTEWGTALTPLGLPAGGGGGGPLPGALPVR